MVGHQYFCLVRWKCRIPTLPKYPGWLQKQQRHRQARHLVRVHVCPTETMVTLPLIHPTAQGKISFRSALVAKLNACDWQKSCDFTNIGPPPSSINHLVQARRGEGVLPWRTLQPCCATLTLSHSSGSFQATLTKVSQFDLYSLTQTQDRLFDNTQILRIY